MRVSVISAVYNEEKTLPRLLDSLLEQTRPPEEIILVDDGSTDGTEEILCSYVRKDPRIRVLKQENRGPAAARNLGWKASGADVCIFTDGDCVPESGWIERLLEPFGNESAGASAGTYKTLNPESLLARFIGLEIAWRYRKVRGEVDAHGSYNLAVRKRVLEEIGGFREDYKKPSGEDWDLTYRISRKYKIMFVPEAVVGHYHPDDFFWYMKNQARRGYDRMRVYKDHAGKAAGDTYTGKLAKFQVAAAGLFLLFLAASAFVPEAGTAAGALIIFLLAGTLIPFHYYFRRDAAAAFFSVPVQFFRFFAWAAGAAAGTLFFYVLNRGEKR